MRSRIRVPADIRPAARPGRDGSRWIPEYAPSALYGPGTRYPGATLRLGGGIEAGLDFVLGLRPLPAGRPGTYQAFVLGPEVGGYGGGTLGFAPTTNEPKGSGDFFFRAGGMLAYQFISMGTRNVHTHHQHGVGLLVGYRAELQYAYVRGYFYDDSLDFVHGPVLAAVFADYIPRIARLTRALVEVSLVHVPATAGYFGTIGGGVAF